MPTQTVYFEEVEKYFRKGFLNLRKEKFPEDEEEETLLEQKQFKMMDVEVELMIFREGMELKLILKFYEGMEL